MNILRNGNWLTRDRLTSYPPLFIVFYLLGFAAIAFTAHGLLDYQDRPLGSDFAAVYAAGTLARDGTPERAYDLLALLTQERDLFGQETALFTWNYPPYFLKIAEWFAALPYLAALGVWQALTLGLFLFSAHQILPLRIIAPLVLAFPGTFTNLGHGQTGFAVAGLLLLGATQLAKRPYLAGVALSLLIFKPHFAFALPLALLAGGHWRAILSGAATFLSLTALTFLAYGASVWQAFLTHLTQTQNQALEYSDTGFEKLQSTFAAIRLMGGSVSFAYAAQITISIVMMAGVMWIWAQRDLDRRIQFAALLVASLAAAPYSFDYDMMLLGAALLCMVAYEMEQGFQPWHKSALFLVWLAPALARPFATATALPLGLCLIFLMAGLVFQLAQRAHKKPGLKSRV